MLAYSPFVGQDSSSLEDEDLFASGSAANDNIEARIGRVRPEHETFVREGFLEKLAASRPHFGRLGRIREFVKNVVLLYEMLVDPSFVIPWRTTAGIIFALAYFISTFDLIPDAIPVIGFFDDALIVAEVVYMFSADIRRFEEMRRARGGNRARKAA
jgi:uncharacterized membrane protein YkvA (DUF1232 family)